MYDSYGVILLTILVAICNLSGMTLTEYKARHKLTDADLARRVGIARVHITNIRNGTRHPSGELLVKLTQKLEGVTADGVLQPFSRATAAE